MPLLYLHLSVANEAAELLRHPVVDLNRGDYLLGSISPDVHYIGGAFRKETHFFDLDEQESESGTSLFFKAHPDLAGGSKVDTATKSFVIGYLSHLVTDEIWIKDIYRPFFGSSSSLGGDPTANVLDRLLQFELDRREREDTVKKTAIRDDLCGSEPQVSIDFIAVTALRQWKDFACTMIDRDVTLADFPRLARGFLLPSKKIDTEQLEPFLSSLTDRLDWVVRYVTPDGLTAFREKVINHSVTVAKEYLGADSQ